MGNSVKNLLVPVRQTAAQMLAAAVLDLYPGTLLAGGQGTAHYFYYDFCFPFAFQNEFLPFIEERMKAIIREKRPLQKKEMIPSNAADLFTHRGQELIAERLESVSEATVQICQIGEMSDYCPLSFSPDPGLPFFKLLEFYDPEISERKITRIVGALELEKSALKAVVKQPLPSSRNHLSLVRKLDYFSPLQEPGMWAWLPKAETMRALLSGLWREWNQRENISLIAAPNLLEAGEIEGVPRMAQLSWIPGEEGEWEGLFSPAASFSDRASLLCPKEKLLEETISSLQFILKIPKILCFEFEIDLSISCAGNQKERQKASNVLEQALKKLELPYTTQRVFRREEHARIEVQLFDALGRKWSGPFLSIPERGKGGALIRSAFGSMERLIALIIEKGAGEVPFWLAPEQIRILTIREEKSAYADEVLQKLKALGVRAKTECGPDPLKTRMYRAHLEKVPIVVLVGDSEEKLRTLKVRDEKGEECVDLEEFIAMIMQRCVTEWKRLI